MIFLMNPKLVGEHSIRNSYVFVILPPPHELCETNNTQHGHLLVRIVILLVQLAVGPCLSETIQEYKKPVPPEGSSLFASEKKITLVVRAEGG